MINNVVLMGRLTAEPELKHTQSGLAFVRFTLAVQRNVKSNNGETETDFISCVAWRTTAEFVKKYFHKGQLVAVEGEIQTGSYTDQNGVRRFTTDVLVSRVHFAEKKREDNIPSQNNLPYPEPPAQYKQPYQYPQNIPDYDNLPPMDNDEDLPF